MNIFFLNEYHENENTAVYSALIQYDPLCNDYVHSAPLPSLAALRGLKRHSISPKTPLSETRRRTGWRSMRRDGSLHIG